MKRFFCNTCQKIRHVRRMPLSVSNPSAYEVTDRIGVCAWHSSDSVRIVRPVSTHKTVKRVKITVAKKGGR